MAQRRLVFGLALMMASVLVARCALQRHPALPPTAGEAPAAPVRETKAADAFRDSVQPMLARRCAPCHVPGGQMYGKMPFDDPEVVRSHEQGILRRIKEPADRDPLTAWLGAPAR
jgi:hypothetical protein